jgi:hypothetical protein
MRGTHYLIALIKVIRLNPNLQQPVKQPPQSARIIVDSRQQYGLAAEGNSRIGQAATSIGRFRGDLIGMREMYGEIKRRIVLQNPRQVSGNPLRKRGRDFGPYAQQLHMANCPQAAGCLNFHLAFKTPDVDMIALDDTLNELAKLDQQPNAKLINGALPTLAQHRR